MPFKRGRQQQQQQQQQTLADYFLSDSSAEEAIVVLPDKPRANTTTKKKQNKTNSVNAVAASSPITRKMTLKRAVSRVRKPTASQASTRKPPARGGKKSAAQPDSEPEHIEDGSSEEEAGQEDDEIEEVDAEEQQEEQESRTRGRGGRRAPQSKTTASTTKKKPATRAGSKVRPAPKGRGKPSEHEETGSEVEKEQTPADIDSIVASADEKQSPKRKGRQAKVNETAPAKPFPTIMSLSKKKKDKQESGDKEIAETQYTPMEVDKDEEIGDKVTQYTPMEVDKDEEIGAKVEEVKGEPPALQSKPTSRKRVASTAQALAAKRLALSSKVRPIDVESSDDELGGVHAGNTAEASLKQQLEGITKKFEEADRKLKALSKLRVTDAEQALEDYKKNMEARIAKSEDLTTALQKDLNAKQDLIIENKRLRKQLASKEAEIIAVQKQLEELEKEIYDVQTENQTLQAKLSIARSHVPVPGSAVKKHSRDQSLVNGNSHNDSIPPGWEAAAKEELYGDLSGLTILSIKLLPDNPNLRVFDCIQTGKNGTLHFKLTTPCNSMHPEDEFTFTPHLDQNRDRVIYALLPEYLREEITFARGNATRFYVKVLNVVMKADVMQAAGMQGGEGPRSTTGMRREVAVREGDQEEDDDDEGEE
ncbi:chromosome segregation protein Csm1/Pcs1-domain-containing protein [Kalaharituber pfeilii]|nr:chromosome segregation protein Csm1/Pcs1-domain-containing protein [Kalaharituber pfeilii]